MWGGLLLALGLLAGCGLDMRDQPRFEAYEASSFFADGASARPRVAGAVARGELAMDAHLHTGRIDGQFAPSFPFTVTRSILERGRERYDIFCTPCHGLLGDGRGIVTEYGMEAPPSFHDPELRSEPEGYYFAIISDGTRVMPAYGDRVPVADRWAIVAYIRALQRSQNSEPDRLPPGALPEQNGVEPSD